MKDVITSLIATYDVTGKYFDIDAIDKLNGYFTTASARIESVKVINANVSAIIKTAASTLFDEQPELIAPGGNANTTRRYAACLRDIDYYLRYATYSIISADVDVLDERVLDGLKETYNSLGVSIAPTVRAIELLRDTSKELVKAAGISTVDFIDEPFDYMGKTLADSSL
uniref:Allophycocyanin beta 18 subunit n=1 Tax=Cyanophora biloba TaxID=1489483 RepID=A0A2Z4HGQ8_9EUKA|nr:allophycocyanin beta 18 subunit [Cyanophora biloba]AWW13823.1 allophycocyanin beta 18 subunit [Cyanophora biloba]